MSYVGKALDLLHQQGWSYGMVSYLDLITGAEVYQIDAHQGDTWEIGRGRTWGDATRHLVKKIYGMPGPGLILH